MHKEKTSGKRKIVRKKKVGIKPSEEKNVGTYSTAITIGDISGMKGKLNIAGRDIKVQKESKGIRVEEVQALFDHVYQTIDSRADTSHDQKESVAAQVKEIQSMVTTGPQKNSRAAEGFLLQRFRNIARIAPEVLDVVVKTLANPILGLADVAGKIAKKAKELP